MAIRRILSYPLSIHLAPMPGMELRIVSRDSGQRQKKCAIRAHYINHLNSVLRRLHARGEQGDIIHSAETKTRTSENDIIARIAHSYKDETTAPPLENKVVRIKLLAILIMSKCKTFPAIAITVRRTHCQS